MILRDYQSSLIDSIYASWNAGNRNVLAVLPTGGGKTACFGTIAKNHIGASIAMAHRQELVAQTSMAYCKLGIAHRIIAPDAVINNITKIHREEFGRSFINPSSLACIASVDTLISRGFEPWMEQVTLWICDEAAHLLAENKWGKAVSMFPNARGLGVTATPCRADGKGLGIRASGVFHAMVLGPTPRYLITAGHLSDYEIVVPQSDFDPARLTIGSTGDFTPKSLKAESKRSKIVGDIVQSYQDWANGTQCIVFVTDVESSDETAERFKSVGIPAASLHAGSNDYERFGIIKRFKNREIRVLINVGLFEEGFDVPGVETVIQARPTKSLSLYLQQIGRGLRPAHGKARALIIDMVNNYLEHGLPDKPRTWTLDDRTSRKAREADPNEIPLTRCTECFKPYERCKPACPYCGHQPVPLARSGPDQVDGDLTLLDLDTLDKLRQSVTLETPQSMANRVATVAGPLAAKAAFNRQYERIQVQRSLAADIAVWAGLGRSSGMSDAELYRRFYFRVGVDVLTALSGDSNAMQTIQGKINATLSN